MTNEELKMIKVFSSLPVLADMLEDMEFKGQVKRQVNLVVNAIRHLDWMLMHGADQESGEQQVDIQLWFRSFFEGGTDYHWILDEIDNYEPRSWDGKYAKEQIYDNIKDQIEYRCKH